VPVSCKALFPCRFLCVVGEVFGTGQILTFLREAWHTQSCPSLNTRRISASRPTHTYQGPTVSTRHASRASARSAKTTALLAFGPQSRSGAITTLRAERVSPTTQAGAGPGAAPLNTQRHPAPGLIRGLGGLGRTVPLCSARSRLEAGTGGGVIFCSLRLGTSYAPRP
jgi:hypothetical protein